MVTRSRPMRVEQADRSGPPACPGLDDQTSPDAADRKVVTSVEEGSSRSFLVVAVPRLRRLLDSPPRGPPGLAAARPSRPPLGHASERRLLGDGLLRRQRLLAFSSRLAARLSRADSRSGVYLRTRVLPESCRCTTRDWSSPLWWRFSSRRSRIRSFLPGRTESRRLDLAACLCSAILSSLRFVRTLVDDHLRGRRTTSSSGSWRRSRRGPAGGLLDLG